MCHPAQIFVVRCLAIAYAVLAAFETAAETPTQSDAITPAMDVAQRRIQAQLDRVGGWTGWNTRLLPFRAELRAETARAKGRSQPVLLGADDFIFSLLELSSIIPRNLYGHLDETPKRTSAYDTILDLAGQLERRGIHLIVAPLPERTDVYRERYVDATIAPPDLSITPYRAKLILDLLKAGVHTVDLFPVFRERRNPPTGYLYHRRDRHWSTRGIRLAAAEIGVAIRRASPSTETITGEREWSVRDREYRNPRLFSDDLESLWTTDHQVVWTFQQVVDEQGARFRPDPTSPILIAGDSFVGMLHAEGGGIGAHLAKALHTTVDVVQAPGAGPAVARLLARRPVRYLDRKRVIVWIFSGTFLNTSKADLWTSADLPE